MSRRSGGGIPGGRHLCLLDKLRVAIVQTVERDDKLSKIESFLDFAIHLSKYLKGLFGLRGLKLYNINVYLLLHHQ